MQRTLTLSNKKTSNKILKWEDLNRSFSREDTNANKQVYRKMLNIINPLGTLNQSHNEISLHMP